MSPARAIAAVLVVGAVGLGVFAGLNRDALRARYWVHRYRTAPTTAEASEALERALEYGRPDDLAIQGALRLTPADVRVTFHEKDYARAILFDVDARIYNVSGRRLALQVSDLGEMLVGARCIPGGEFRPLDRSKGPMICGTSRMSFVVPIVLDPEECLTLHAAHEIESLKAQAHAAPDTRAIELRLAVRVQNAPTPLATNDYRIEIAP